MSNSLQKRTVKSVWMILFSFMFLCCSGLLTAWFISKRSASRALEAKLQQLGSKGIPIDDAAMTAYHHSLSSDENATQWVLILETIASQSFRSDCAGLPIVSDTALPIPPLGKPWNEQPAVEKFLQNHTDTINGLIDLAQNNGPVRMPIKFNSASTLLPYTQNSRDAVRIVQLEALVAARQGDAEREFRAINAMFGCAIAIHGEPIIISQLVAMAIQGMAITQLQDAVQFNRLGSKHYEQLMARIAPLSSIRQSFTVAFNGHLGMTNGIVDESTLQWNHGKWAPLLVKSGIAERAALKYALRIEETLDAPVDDLKAFREYMQGLDAKLNQKKSSFDIELKIVQSFANFSSNFTTALIRRKTSSDLAILAISIRQFEQAHGRLPENLSELESQGIQLEQFKAVDGSVPNYQLFDSTSQASRNCRAMLWSFDFEKESAISPTPPQPATIDQPNPKEASQWWHWKFE